MLFNLQNSLKYETISLQILTLNSVVGYVLLSLSQPSLTGLLGANNTNLLG